MIIPIPIIIPTGYTYSCTVSGTMFKIVPCEHCRFVYVYKMQRTSAGTSHESILIHNPYAAQQAEAAASYDLRQKLQQDCDAIPCLECGKYQQHMIEALKQDFMNNTWYAGWIGFGAGIVGLLMAIVAFVNEKRDLTTLIIATVGIALVAGGMFALKWRTRQLQQFNPNNSDLAERMQLAKRYAKTLEEFQAYLKHQGIEWQLPPDLADAPKVAEKNSESIQPSRRRRRSSNND